MALTIIHCKLLKGGYKMKLKKLYVLTINSKSGVCILRPTMFRSDELKKVIYSKGKFRSGTVR